MWSKPYLRTFRNKYGAKRVTHSGMSFDSKLEASVYDMLCLRQKAGEIRELRAKTHVFLTDARIEMIPDFNAVDINLGEVVWIEAKGFETDVWRVKKKLWGHYGPGRMEVWKACTGGYGLKLVETIIPKGLFRG